MSSSSDVEARLAALEARSVINALGEQTAGRFDHLQSEMRTGFAEMRGKLDQTAAGQELIVGLLNTL